MIINKNGIPRIVACMVVKNEADIIGSTIEHHINQGVSQFLITDNSSADNTVDIIRKYPEVVDLFYETDDTHNQQKSATRMAQEAVKLKPDWIIHIDADEFWCGLPQLRKIRTKAISSYRMLIHPPTTQIHAFDAMAMRYYLNFENILGYAGDTKVAHRPDPSIQITHGNHGFVGQVDVTFTKDIYRHHYPIRSYQHLENKARLGHAALARRNAPCPRWEKWHNLCANGQLFGTYKEATEAWERMIKKPNFEDMEILLSFWSSEEITQAAKKVDLLPIIGQWPRATDLLKPTDPDNIQPKQN